MGRVETKFKETEVGLVPWDWEVKDLGEIGEVQMCRRIFNNQTSSEGAIPFYKIGTFGKTPDAYISQELYNEYRIKFSFPNKGDILISAAGTIGRTIVYNGEDSYFQDSNIVWIENNKNLISNELFYHILQIAKFNTEGGTIQRLYNSILKSKKIAIPPTKTEQTAIANALSDVDGYIESLEKLIAKKQKIKQGAMQQLLKPQPHWEVKKLGELCSITTGKLDANAMVENGKYRFYTCAKEFYFINEYAFETEALLVSGNGANVGYIHYYNGKFNAYQRTYVMDEFDENILFIKYHLEFDLHKRISIEKNEGNTPYIVMSTLTEMMINLPNKDEQKEISQTLSNIDSEITTLNQKLTKAKDLKQGMMQQLLTGKIRLL